MKYRLLITLPIYATLYVASLAVAFNLRFDLQMSGEPLFEFTVWLPIIVAIKCVLFAAAREWNRQHRYSSLVDVAYAAVVSSLASLLIYGLNSLEWVSPWLHRSIILIDWGTTILATLVLRSVIRVGIEQANPTKLRKTKRAVIYGADQASVAMLRSIRVSVPEFNVVGMIDETEVKARSFAGGVRVFSMSKGLAWIAHKSSARYLLIPNCVPAIVRELFRNCQTSGIKPYVIPALGDIVDGRVKLTLSDITISDLLRRAPTRLDMAGIAEYIESRTVVVTARPVASDQNSVAKLLASSPQK